MAGTAVLGRLTWLVGTVAAVRSETGTARSIVFDVPGWPGHVAGQHVDVRLTAADGYSAVRSYSLASAPSHDGRVEITVERLANGEVSPYLTQDVAAGDKLELRGPIGGWFVWAPDRTEPVQLVAGGSGLVPLMAMIRSRGAAKSSAPFRLLYSVREPGAVLYAGELRARAERGELAVSYAYTRSAPKDWPVPPGRIDAAFVARAVWPESASPTCYVCGPTAFVERAAALIGATGIPAERIRTERFGPTGEPR